MALEVPCPACGTQLRAPDDAAGKRVKCKKCEHRFLIPGEIIAEPIGESQQLSAIDKAPPLPPPAVLSAAPAPSGDPFSFDDPGGLMVSVGGRGKKPSARKPERRTSQDEAETADEPKRNKREVPAKKGGGGAKKVLLIVGGILGFLFLTCMGGIAALWFLVLAPAMDKVKTLSTAKPKLDAPAPEFKAAPPDEDPAFKKAPEARPKGGKGGKVTEKAAATIPMPKDGMATAPPTATPEPDEVRPSRPVGPEPKAGTIVSRVQNGFTVDIPLEAIRDVRFGAGAEAVAAILWTADKGFQGSGGRDAVDLYSTNNGFRTVHVEIEAKRQSNIGGNAAALDPGSLFYAYSDGDSYTVIDLTTKKAILIIANPFAGEEFDKNEVRQLVFAESGSLIALTRQGYGTVRKLADGSFVKSIHKNRSGYNKSTEDINWAGAAAGRATFPAVAKNGRELLTLSTAPGLVGDVLKVTLLPRTDRGFVADTVLNDRKDTWVAGITPLSIQGVQIFTRKTSMIEYFAVPNVGGQVVDARTLVGDRAIAVVGKDRASGYVFDLETKKVAFALPAGTTPYRLFVDDANNLLYFASEVDVKKTRFVGVRVDFDDYHAVANGSPGGADATPLTATLEGLKR